MKPEVSQLSVVIPTYRRENALVNCVQSILRGSELPSEILIVGREGDQDTQRALDRLANGLQPNVNIRPAWVKIPGHIPPIEMGLQLATNDLIAFLDDDVTVSEDWLRTLLPNFADSSVGIVGGRVVVPGSPIPEAERETWPCLLVRQALGKYSERPRRKEHSRRRSDGMQLDLASWSLTID